MWGRRAVRTKRCGRRNTARARRPPVAMVPMMRVRGMVLVLVLVVTMPLLPQQLMLLMLMLTHATMGTHRKRRRGLMLTLMRAAAAGVLLRSMRLMMSR